LQALLARELAAAPPPRVLPLCTPGVEVNAAHTRTFLTLETVPDVIPALTATSAAVTAALAAHGLPPVPPAAPFRPHVSVAWAWGDAELDVKAAMAHAKTLAGELECWPALVHDIRLLVGDEEFIVWTAADAR
jgi:hypothetical protein